MRPPAFTGASTLGLCPFVVKGRGDHYSVIDREGRRAISTSQAGVEAIRLLAAGRSVEDTRSALGRRHGCPAGEIDLEPLLATLFASGFVRTLDGCALDSGGERPGRHLRLWLTLLVWTPLLELALKHLPLRLALPLTYRWFGRAAAPEPERCVAGNVERAPKLERTPRDAQRIATANRQAVRRQFCDRLLLGSLPPRRARRWLGGTVRVSGLEHLLQSRASGKGTILCSFHFGSYGLVPFVLGARGVPVTMYAGFGQEARTDVANWLAERARLGDEYPVRLTGGTMGLRTLARRAARGETVLLYCDRAPGERGGPPEPDGLLRVPFLGTWIWSGRGLAWLRERTGAAVLPTVLAWEGRWGHHLHIDRDVTPAAGAGEPGATDALMAAAYGALERHVQREPAQWLKWEDFAAMIAP